MAFSKEDLVTIAKSIGLKKVAGKSLEELERAIKAELIQIRGRDLILEEHIKDAYKWLSEIYPNEVKKWTEEDIANIIDIVVNYIDDTYPKYDDFTMYELIKEFEPEIKELLSELVV